VNVAAIAFSERGRVLGERLTPYFSERGDAFDVTLCKEGELKVWTAANFSRDALIFIGSCGIAVRAAAPFLNSKKSDPAVVVIDELATFAISLLSGHVGGANDLTLKIARFLNAAPIITTATDVSGTFAIDAWAVKQGLKIANPECIKRIAALLLANETVKLQSEFPVVGKTPKGVALCDSDGDAIIAYTASGRSNALRLVPPVVALGVGCKKGVSREDVENAFELALNKANCHPLAAGRVYSVDLKAREPGILEFCRARSLPYKTFSARELMAAPGTFSSSEFVTRITGADNVCERSAALGAGEGGRALCKVAANGVTMALALSPFTARFYEEELL
jgi:cobalt-precorrin 5A hydrolase